jgi:hypothetical protein
MTASWRRYAAGIVAALLCALPHANAIILFRTGDPTANTTEPTGDLAGSGWQYQGLFGAFLGTAIAPHFFITVKHIGVQSNTFFYRDVNYTILQSYDDPNGDLRIYKVVETLPDYAQLYSRSDEVGQRLVVFGRGTQRGSELFSNGILRGWGWGGADTAVRWGENEVAEIVPTSSLGDLLYALFDQDGLPEEAHLSSGDSGGAVFLNDGGVWKLAALNYAVDGPYYTAPGAAGFDAALFDTRGFYDSGNVLISGNLPIPSGFYASRISTKRAWIQSVIGPVLGNISTRAFVGAGDGVCIAGFIIQGDASKTKRILVRGIGPSLQPLAGTLADPVIELHGSTGALLLSNNDWRSSQEIEIQNSGLAPANDKESALIADLPPGDYTAVLRGNNSTTGIGLIEVYDLDEAVEPHLGNLSARADVETGDGVLIGGLIVRSQESLLLRAIGPELKASGVAGVLDDPLMELHDSNGALLISNDNWKDAPDPAAIQATGLAPTDDRESAILVTPAPGNYTAIVQGAGNSTGIALVEAYLVNQ